MDIFQVALELEGGGELAITVLADSMTIHLAVLLIKFHVVLHMIHESVCNRAQRESIEIKSVIREK